MMTVTIDFTAKEEAWLNAQTLQYGISPAEFIRQLVDERIPAANGTRAVPTDIRTVIDDDNTAAIAYLEARLAEGANASAEEARQVEEEFEELQHNLNANRDVTGERRVFP